MTQTNYAGVFTSFSDLSENEQALVLGVWDACKNAYVPRSDFPVGCLLLAENERGETRLFHGCNVESHRCFSTTICGERNAVTTAVAAGYTKLVKLALAFTKYQGPGASPCGLCRQVLIEFGPDADVFNMADAHNNVLRFKVAELLPRASGKAVSVEFLPDQIQRLVRQCLALRKKSYVPYSKQPQAAITLAANNKGKFRRFAGVTIDNASYGGSGMAGCIALQSAHSAGYFRDVTLAVTVENLQAPNPVEGEVLQVLREFGLGSKVLLIGLDGMVVQSSIDELLPDSFGPQSLA